MRFTYASRVGAGHQGRSRGEQRKRCAAPPRAVVFCTIVGVLFGLGTIALGTIGNAAKPSAERKPAGAGPTFDQLVADAEPVSDLAALIDPLFDSCDAGSGAGADAVAYRQCEGARAFLEAQARERTYVAIGDPAALDVSPYDPTTKQVDLDVHGCLACLRPPRLVDAKGAEVPRFVTTRAPRAIKAGHAVGLDVGSLELEMSTPGQEQKWRKAEKRLTRRLRVQFVFKLGPVWTSGSFSGVTFVPLAYRVFDACSGEVYASSTAAGASSAEALGKVATPVALRPGDPLTCPAPGQLTAEEQAAKDAWAKLPAELSRADIEKAMSAVQARVHDCHVEFEETGVVNLRLVVDGSSGKVKEAHVLPPFDKTPGGLCVRAALHGVSFTKFRADTQEIKLPVYLR